MKDEHDENRSSIAPGIDKSYILHPDKKKKRKFLSDEP
jgi:hypothetical protein